MLHSKLQTGTGLVGPIWAAVGVVVFTAIIAILFKFFFGAKRNLVAGFGALVGVGIVAALAATPTECDNLKRPHVGA